MSTFGEDRIQSVNEVLAHPKGEGTAIVHAPATPRDFDSTRSTRKRRWRV